MANVATESQGPDYGVDAPGFIIGFGSGGVALALGAILARTLLPSTTLGTVLTTLLTLAAFVPLTLGAAMIAYTLLGKARTRERILGMVPWNGTESVLDVGTGGGLLLIGAAKRLTSGTATGTDVWNAADQSNNHRDRALRNAEIEGVADRVRVVDADAREMAFADDSFDVILSLLCLHNIESKDGQAQACREIARVLRPGGVVVVGDYLPTHDYAAAFRAAGLDVVHDRAEFGTALSLMWIVRAVKPAARRGPVPAP